MGDLDCDCRCSDAAGCMALASGADSIDDERYLPDSPIEPCECDCHDEVSHG